MNLNCNTGYSFGPSPPKPPLEKQDNCTPPPIQFQAEWGP